MWNKRPNALTDGLVCAGVVSLVLVTFLSLVNHSDSRPTVSQHMCQEIVIEVERKGNVLARCPPGMHIDIIKNNAVCRCTNQFSPDPEPTIDPELEPEPDAGGGIEL